MTRAPRKKKIEKRNCVISVRMTEKQMADLERAAREMECSLPDMARWCLKWGTVYAKKMLYQDLPPV